MLQSLGAFLLFLGISLFGWFVSYSDYEDLLICYGCTKIDAAYDFVIVGGGTAGCVLARRLAENSSASILIIEAGGRGNGVLSVPVISPLLQQSNFDWKYKTTRQSNACLSFHKQRCMFPVGKGLGGSHQLNNMIYTRGHPLDYESWFQDLPGYSYEKDIEHYFKRAEQIYAQNETVSESFNPALVTPVRYLSQASLHIVNSFLRIGYRTSEPTLDFFSGFYRPFVTQKNGRRWTTADHLLEMKFPNVVILSKATAEKVVFNDNYEATGVKFDYIGVSRFVKARRAVILSAGTVGSAKLLMLSGIGPKNHLKKIGIKLVRDLPVGNNLQDHLATGFDLMHVNKKIGLSIGNLLDIREIWKYLFLAKGAWTSNGVDLIGFTNVDFIHCKNNIKNNVTLCYEKYWANRPDVELMMMPLGLTTDMGIHLRTLLGITDDVWDEYFGNINETSMSAVTVLLHPKSRGTVRLANKNHHSKPLIDPNYLSHPHDLKILVAHMMRFKKIFDKVLRGQENIHLYEKNYPGCENFEFGTLCYWKCYLKRMSTSSYHPIGTCKMGIREDSVVNFDLQVHGTNKLFVVDASVLPGQISGHIMAPIIMMAERASDFITRYHGFEIGKVKQKSFPQNTT
ncbi:hypothetical protein WA026_010739 [Henosepilachna vigintioctopunctata]|uniref:Uncharacterized protein n=1 Tax=Henosepilachna vigintioctopunctata TaxID=420089 RepID=A0AAW1UNQ8_9CUCU